MSQVVNKRKAARKANRKKAAGFSEKVGNKVVVPRVYGFADRYECKLEYKEVVNFTGTGTTTNYQFLVNSLFDPNGTGVGHQPRFFDQLKAVYGQYLVTKVHWKIRFINANSTVARWGICISDTAQSSTPLTEICEMKYSKSGWLSQNTGGPNQGRATGNMRMATLFGVKYIDAVDELFANVGSNPADPAYLVLCVAGPAGTEALSVYAEVELDYYCIFRHFFDPSSSLKRKDLESEKIDEHKAQLAKVAPIDDKSFVDAAASIRASIAALEKELQALHV